jgi:hypothetical protein
MAQTFGFPPLPHEPSAKSSLGKGVRHDCLTALRFVYNSIRTGAVQPTKMFIVYGTRDGAETIWSYLNLGFDPNGLTKAVCRVLDDVEDRDEERDD